MHMEMNINSSDNLSSWRQNKKEYCHSKTEQKQSKVPVLIQEEKTKPMNFTKKKKRLFEVTINTVLF